jgi:hypothetical protein
VIWHEQPHNIQAVLICRWAGLSKVATAYRLRVSTASLDRALAFARKTGFNVPSAHGVSGEPDTSLIWARIEKEVLALQPRQPRREAEKAKPTTLDLDREPCCVVLSLQCRGLKQLEARQAAAQYYARANEREANARRIARSFFREISL